MATKLQIEKLITVGDLADKLSIPVTKLITELMKNGIMATVNERIDFDTAQIIVEEMSLDYELELKSADEKELKREKPKVSENASSRPPVVAVMGHVDHGKTSLLDSIRGKQEVDKEAGGITQHISAYQVSKGDRAITFLDTPGHEAFAAIREHGAVLTDLAVIVVAGDDGIKPQTEEAIRYAQKAGVKMLIAINKMDKPEANADLVKGQLAEKNIMVSDKVYKGDTEVVEVSAKTGMGIDDLLDRILLMADVEDLRADEDGDATGLIIEAHMEPGRGPVGIALVESGILKPGQFLVAGGSYARIRNLEDTEGKALKLAKPSTPVVITGFKQLPEFGDEFYVVGNEKDARNQAEKNAEIKKQEDKTHIGSTELIRIMDRNKQLTNLNIIVKADVKGSLTSVIDSLKTLNTDEVAVRIVGSGIGAISENDIHMAKSSDAIIYAFSLDVANNIRRSASRDKVSLRSYNIIYELIDDVKAEMEQLLSPEVVQTDLGRLVVKGVFKTTKSEIICGGEVTKGKLSIPALCNIYRDKELIGEAEVTNLKRGPVDAAEVLKGEMCGMNLKTESKIDLQEGDHIELFTRETVARKLT